MKKLTSASGVSRVPKKTWSLDIHASKTYLLTISVTRGSIPEKFKINWEDIVGAEGAKKLAEAGVNQISVPAFDSVNKGYNKLDGHRKKMQGLMICSGGALWLLPEGALGDILALEDESNDILKDAVDIAVAGRAESLSACKGRAWSALEQFHASPDILRRAMARIEESYPTVADIEACLGFTINWLAEIQSTGEALKDDLELRRRQADLARDEALAAEARAAAAEAEARAGAASEAARLEAEAIAGKARSEADAAKRHLEFLEAAARIKESASRLDGEKSAGAAAKISAEIEALEANVTKLVKRSKSISEPQQKGVEAALVRLSSFVELAAADQREALEAQIAGARRNVMTALTAPIGAFEAESLDRELGEAAKALTGFIAGGGDIDSPEAADRKAHLAKLKARIELTRAVLKREDEALVRKMEEAETLVYGAPQSLEAFDEVLGF